MPGIGVAALAGNLAVHALPALPGALLLSATALAASLCLCRPPTRWLGVALLAFCLTGAAAAQRLAARWPASRDGEDVEVSGFVADFPDVGSERSLFAFRVDGTSQQLAGQRLRLSWYDAPADLGPGDPLDLTVRLRAPRGLANPGGFDYERWLFAQGYAARGYVRAAEPRTAGTDGLAARWLRLRAAIAGRIAERVADPDAAALITALALGERRGFEDRHWSLLRRTGTSHLVAISGMHVGLVASAAFVCLLRLILRLPVALARHAWTLAAVSALLPAAGYAALAGFAVPTQRALVMLLVAQLAIVLRRRFATASGLALALVAVLALDPFASLTASFWLSFAAVGLLLALAGDGAMAASGARGHPAPARPATDGAEAGVDAAGHPARAPGRRWSGLLRGLRVFTRLQCGITIGLIPLLAMQFGEISLVGLGVNLVAIPLFSLVLVPLALLCAAIACFQVPGLGIVELTSWLAAGTWDLLGVAAAWPQASVPLPAPTPGAGLVAVAAVCLAFLPLPLPGRRLALLGLLPLLLAGAPAPRPGELRMTVLDVGHGLAVMLETHSHLALFDAGPAVPSGFDAGSELVLPALRTTARRTLDLVIVSHGDNDHAGGVAAVLAAHPSAAVLHGPDLRAAGGQSCSAGQRWRWDGVEFELLHPPADFAPLGNESSCVLRIETPGGAALLTGDIEKRAEQQLVGRGRLAADVVVVPHHGSATSSTPSFVRAVSPSLALVSAGHGNRWGFPRPEVRAAWETEGAEMLVTGDHGAIEVVLGRDEPVLRLWRRIRPHYWNAGLGSLPGARPGTAL